jgi:hypothetical protein
MQEQETIDQALLDQLQFSVDAVGTIVNTDLPRIAAAISSLDDKLSSVVSALKRDDLVLKELGSNMQDLDAKLDMLLGKVDLLERRISELAKG